MLTRLAPTPSGFLHIGNAYSFALTAAIARQNRAAIMLRIDDMDSLRVTPEYVSDIFATLRYLGIPWDKGPRDESDFYENYSQRLRMALYEEALRQLRLAGLVYACACSRKHTGDKGTCVQGCREKGLSLDTPELPWRIKTDRETMQMKEPNGTKTEKLPEKMKDFIVRRKDALPAYQLTSLVDDQHFGVNLIVRGRDLYDSTIAQLLLASKLGYKEFLNCTFIHHQLLTNFEGSKLSKSSGSTSVQWLRDQGRTSQEIYVRIGKASGQGNISSWEEILG